MYYIVHVGSRSYFIHPKGVEKKAFDSLVLWTFENENHRFNIVTDKPGKKMLMHFSDHPQLEKLLSDKMFRHNTIKIVEHNEDYTYFALAGNQSLKIEPITWEGRSYYEYHLMDSGSSKIFKVYAADPPKEYVHDKTEIVFEGKPSASGGAPKEIKEYLTRRNSDANQQNLLGIVLFILVVLFIGWLII